MGDGSQTVPPMQRQPDELDGMEIALELLLGPQHLWIPGSTFMLVDLDNGSYVSEMFSCSCQRDVFYDR